MRNRNFWKKENCHEFAKKCKTKEEFRNKYPGAYDASIKKNWFNEVCSHMLNLKKPKNFWNIKNAIEVSKLCKSKGEFQKLYGTAYHLLRKHGLLKQINLPSTKRKLKWDYKNCLIEAKKYKYVRDWIIKGKGSYNASRKNGWLKECTKHMLKLGSKHKRLIYSFEFPDQSVYVGLTYNENVRRNEHLSNKRKKSTVYKYIEETGLIPKFIVLSDFMVYKVASIKEGEILNIYRSKGWKILNKVKTGGLGAVSKWNYENCKKEALKYMYRSEFHKKSSSAYAASKRNGWFKEITKHMKLLRKRDYDKNTSTQLYSKRKNCCRHISTTW